MTLTTDRNVECDGGRVIGACSTHCSFLDLGCPQYHADDVRGKR